MAEVELLYHAAMLLANGEPLCPDGCALCAEIAKVARWTTEQLHDEVRRECERA